jgi:polyhydroxyalkanoate synthesis regulator phasin
VALAGMGAAITGSLTAMAVSWGKSGEEIAKMSQKTGMSAKTLSELKYAADMSGATIDSLETSFQKMSSVLFDAQNGSKASADALNNLGLSITQLTGMKPEDQFMTVASALAGVGDASTRAALAQDVFGKAGTDLLPMLANGTQGLNDMMTEADRLGVAFDEKAAAAAARFNDALEKMAAAGEGVKNIIGEAVAPALEDNANAVTSMTTAITGWLGLHPDMAKALSDTILQMGELALGTGTVLVGFKGWTVAAKALGPVAAALGTSVATLAAAIAGLAVGLGMILYGVNYIINQKKEYAEITRINNGLEQDFQNALNGNTKAFMENSQAVIDYAEKVGNLNDDQAKYIQLLKDEQAQIRANTVERERNTETAMDSFKKLKAMADLMGSKREDLINNMLPISLFFGGALAPSMEAYALQAAAKANAYAMGEDFMRLPGNAPGTSSTLEDTLRAIGVTVNVNLDGDLVAKSVETRLGDALDQRQRMGG